MTRNKGVRKFSKRIWPRPKVVRRKNLSVEPPGDDAGAIEFQQLFGLKASGLADLKELVFGIAAAMPQYFVQCAEKFWTVWDKHDGAAAFFQRIPYVAQCLRDRRRDARRRSGRLRCRMIRPRGNEVASVASTQATRR